METENMLQKYKTSGILILIPKIENYITYVFQLLVKIPRVENFNIGSEIKTSTLKMLEYAHFINKDRKNSYEYLNKIDALISYNRSMIRILDIEKSISHKQFEVCINQLADKILKEYKINDLVLIEGKLRAKEEMFIIANEIEKLDYKIKRLGNKNGKMVKK